MFEPFTDGSRRAVVLAQESAVDLHHSSITVEHLLLGVARSELGAGAGVLAEQGATPDRLRQAVRKAVPSHGTVPSDGHVPFTHAAKKVMELSLREAMKRGADSIDTGHILAALLRQGGDELTAVLAAAGLSAASLGRTLERRLAELARDSPDGPPAQSQLDRIEALLLDLVARVEAMEARLDHPPAG